MATRRRRQQRPPKKQARPTGVTLTPAQAKVVRALARDRQHTIDEANRMLGEAEAAMGELAATYAALYGLACGEGERFDFEPAGDEILLKVVEDVPPEPPPGPPAETPPERPPEPPTPGGDPGDNGAGPEGGGGEGDPPAETPPED